MPCNAGTSSFNMRSIKCYTAVYEDCTTHSMSPSQKLNNYVESFVDPLHLTLRMTNSAKLEFDEAKMHVSSRAAPRKVEHRMPLFGRGKPQ